MISIGQRIKQLIKQKGYTVTEFAQRIHCSRRTLYEIFNKNNINTELLLLISKELNVNLFEEISQVTEAYLQQEGYLPKKDKAGYPFENKNILNFADSIRSFETKENLFHKKIIILIKTSMILRLRIKIC